MTFRQGQRVIVDTNVIIEAHRTGCWTTLTHYFEIETVEKVVEETQTGAQNRAPETHINEQVLRASLTHVATITDAMRAKFHEAYPTAVLDPGERDLIVYAGTLKGNDTWLLNSPDMAAVRHAHSRGWLDRVVSLEAMNRQLKGHLSAALKDNYTEQWLSVRRTRLILGCLAVNTKL